MIVRRSGPVDGHPITRAHLHGYYNPRAHHFGPYERLAATTWTTAATTDGGDLGASHHGRRWANADHDRWGVWGFSVLEVRDGDYERLVRIRPIVADCRRFVVADAAELIADGFPLLATLDSRIGPCCSPRRILCSSRVSEPTSVARSTTLRIGRGGEKYPDEHGDDGL